MNLPLLLLVLSVATFRATRLIIKDTFPPLRLARNWIVGRRRDVQTWPAEGKAVSHGPGGPPEWEHWWLGELVTCKWCASGWVSMALVGFVWPVVDLDLPVRVWIVCWLAVWGTGAVLVDRLG